MPKMPKGRIAEQRYAKRVRDIHSKQKKKTKTKGSTPWKEFFHQGIGAIITTEIPKSSIHSIVYTYGKNMGKKFVCSYEQTDEGTLVKIEAVERR